MHISVCNSQYTKLLAEKVASLPVFQPRALELASDWLLPEQNYTGSVWWSLAASYIVGVATLRRLRESQQQLLFPLCLMFCGNRDC